MRRLQPNHSVRLLVFCLFAAIAAHAQTFSVLTSFDSTNGANPVALTQGLDGSFYGTTEAGGILNSRCDVNGPRCGTIFGITPSGGLTTYYEFCSQTNCNDGFTPVAGLVLSTNGSFYGTTLQGGTGNGTIFRLSPKGSFSTIFDLNETTGDWPFAPLVFAANHALYGTANNGGADGVGSVFSMSLSGAFTTVFSFNQKDGEAPRGLIEGSDGNFYGTTFDGGAGKECGNFDWGCGTIFRLSRNGKLATIYSFCKTNCSDGAKPQQLLQGTDGNLYGVTFEGGVGGAYGPGVIFRITPSGSFSVLYSFCSQTDCADGTSPESLMQASDGNLYGVAAQGGSDACLSGCGTIFKLTLDGVFTTLYSFQPSGAYYPGSIMQATDGKFYGTTGGGIINSDCQFGCGTIYKFDTSLGPFVSFVLSAGAVGQSAGVLGQGFAGTTSVTLNGTPMSFTVVSDTFIKATIPSGATTGYVTVATPSGTLTSIVPFQIIP